MTKATNNNNKSTTNIAYIAEKKKNKKANANTKKIKKRFQNSQCENKIVRLWHRVFQNETRREGMRKTHMGIPRFCPYIELHMVYIVFLLWGIFSTEMNLNLKNLSFLNNFK